MFSAFKRLTSKTNDLQTPQNVPPETAGHTMSGSLQKKFSRGVQYNSEFVCSLFNFPVLIFYLSFLQ